MLPVLFYIESGVISSFLAVCPCFLTIDLCIGVGKTRGIRMKGKSGLLPSGDRKSIVSV